MAHDHDHSDHDHEHDHHHGNAKDRGFKAILRYVRIAPRMWTSVVNDAVVDLVAPAKGQTVVDIGAGMGPGVVRAAATGADVIAVDPTPFMRTVMSARRLASRNRKCIQVVDGAAESLPVRDGQADAVWSVNTMHHWTSAAEGAIEIARVLAPGGRVVLVDENFADSRHPNTDEWHKRHADSDHHGFSMVDATEIGDLMTAAGLTNVVAEQRDLAGRPVIAVLANAPA